MAYRDTDTPEAPEEGPYPQLAAWARARNVPFAGAPQVRARVDGRAVTVSLRIDSGVVRGVVVEATADHHEGPHVRLRPETTDDALARERGLAVEAQTGDPAFDPKVYVETDLTSEAVLPMLTPEVRASALALLDLGCDPVEWRDGLATVTLDLGERGEGLFAVEVLDALAAHVAVLSRAPAASSRAVDPRARAAGRFFTGVIVAAVVGLVGLGVSLSLYPPVHAAPPLVAAVAGFLASLGFPLVTARFVRGAARSHTLHLASVVLGVVGLPTLSVAVLLGLNGLFDRAPATDRQGAVLTVDGPDEGEWSVRVRWSDGEESVESLSGERAPSRGARVTLAVHPGALGIAWREALRER